MGPRKQLLKWLFYRHIHTYLQKHVLADEGRLANLKSAKQEKRTSCPAKELCPAVAGWSCISHLVTWSLSLEETTLFSALFAVSVSVSTWWLHIEDIQKII